MGSTDHSSGALLRDLTLKHIPQKRVDLVNITGTDPHNIHSTTTHEEKLLIHYTLRV